MANNPVKWFSRALNAIRDSDTRSASGAQWFSFLENLAKKGEIKKGEIDYLGLPGMLVGPGYDPNKTFTREQIVEPLQELIPRTQSLTLDAPHLTYDQQDERARLQNMLDAGTNLTNSEMEAFHNLNEQNSRMPLWGNAGLVGPNTFARYPTMRSMDGQNYREYLLWHPNARPDDIHLDLAHFGQVGSYDPVTGKKGDEGLRQIAWGRAQELENPLGGLPGHETTPTLNIEEGQSNRHALGKKIGYTSYPVLRSLGAGFGSPMGDAPFKQDWPALVFRRALWDAAVNGNSALSWTGPLHQRARWGESGIGNNAIDTYGKKFPAIGNFELKRLGEDGKVHYLPHGQYRSFTQDEIDEAERDFSPFIDDRGNWVNSFDDLNILDFKKSTDMGLMPLNNRMRDRIQEEGLPLFKDGGEVDLSPERFYRDRMSNANGQHAYSGGGLAKRLPQAASGLFGALGLGDLGYTLGKSEYPALQRIFGDEGLDPESSRAYVRDMQSKYLSEEPDPDDVFGAPGGGSILGHVADWAMRHPVDALDMVDPTGLVSSGLDMADRYNYAGDYKGKESESSIADYPRILINNFAFGLPELLSSIPGLERMYPLGASSADEINRLLNPQPQEKPKPEPIKFEYGAQAYGRGGTVFKRLKNTLEELEDLLSFQRGRGVEITPEMEAQAREGVGAGLGAAYSLADAKGLDMSTEARMRRMAEQGYDNPAYHGTHYEPRLAPRGDFPQFADWLVEDPYYMRTHSTALGTHLAEDPTMANAMADASSIAFKDRNALVADELEEETTTNAFKNHYTPREREELLNRIATLRATPAKFEPQGGYVLPLRFRGDFHDLNNDPTGTYPEASDDVAVARDIFDFAMKGRGNHPGLGMDWFKDQIMKARRSEPFNWKGGIGGEYIGPTKFFQNQGTSDLGYFGPDTVAGRDVIEAYRNYLREKGTPNLGYTNTEELEVDNGDPLSYIIPSIDDMRSPFAAFDPDNQGSGHILGGVAGLGALGALSGAQEPEKFMKGGSAKGHLLMQAWEAAKAAAKAAGEKPPKRPWGDRMMGTGVWADPPELGPKPRGRNMPGTPWGGRGGHMIDKPVVGQGSGGYTTPRPVSPGALEGLFEGENVLPESGLLTLEQMAQKYAEAPRGAIHEIFDRADALKKSYVDYGLGDYDGGIDYE